jgi:hypothetical protein
VYSEAVEKGRGEKKIKSEEYEEDEFW